MNAVLRHAHLAYTYDFATADVGFNRVVDKQGFGTGNVWSDAQFSNFIRPADEVMCNNITFEPGRLQDWDLRPYSERNVPSWFLTRIAHCINDHKGGQLHLLRCVTAHRNDPPGVRVYGVVLTDLRLRPLMAWQRSGARHGASVVTTVWDWFDSLDHTPIA